MNHAFGVSKKSSPYPMSSSFPPMLSSRSFRSVIYSELISVWIQFFACRCAVPLSFVEKTVFVLLYCLCFFVKDQLTVCVGSFFFFLIGNFLIVAKVTCVGKKTQLPSKYSKKIVNYILRSFVILFYQKGVLIEGYFKLKKPK